MINTRSDIFMVRHNPNYTDGIYRQYKVTKQDTLWTIESEYYTAIDATEWRVVDSFEHDTTSPITALKFYIECTRKEMIMQYGYTDWLPTRGNKTYDTTQNRISPPFLKCEQYRDIIRLHVPETTHTIPNGSNTQNETAKPKCNTQKRPTPNTQWKNTSQNKYGL